MSAGEDNAAQGTLSSPIGSAAPVLSGETLSPPRVPLLSAHEPAAHRLRHGNGDHQRSAVEKICYVVFDSNDR